MILIHLLMLVRISSDDFIKGIKFEDNKEEKMNGFDDGFDDGFYKGLDDGQPTNTRVVYGAGSSEVVNHSFITPEMGKNM